MTRRFLWCLLALHAWRDVHPPVPRDGEQYQACRHCTARRVIDTRRFRRRAFQPREHRWLKGGVFVTPLEYRAEKDAAMNAASGVWRHIPVHDAHGVTHTRLGARVGRSRPARGRGEETP